MCRFILFAPMVAGYILICVHGCHKVERTKIEAPKGRWNVDFNDVDLVRYNSLLQVILDDIRKECKDVGRNDEEADFLAMSFLWTNAIFVHQELFPGSSRTFFIETLADFYDRVKPLMDEETK